MKAREDAFNLLLDRAVLEPDTAAMLLKEQNHPANRAVMQRKAKLWLGNQAATVAEMLGDEERDPVKDALNRPCAIAAYKTIAR
jgi:hypothetical protein